MRVLAPGIHRMKKEMSNKGKGKESIVQLHFPQGFARDSSSGVIGEKKLHAILIDFIRKKKFSLSILSLYKSFKPIQT